MRRREFIATVGAAVAPANRDLIVRLAVQHHLPAIYAGIGFVPSGGLISYFADPLADYRRVAGYVDGCCTS